MSNSLTQTSYDSIRILIVDDNHTNLKVLSEAIRHENWITLVATDGESAIEQAKYAQPDLILLDVMMPGIDGFETCQRLKKHVKTQSIPIIFMTALSDVVDKVKGLELGAVDYITKPFQQEEVLARWLTDKTHD
jgi:DNA-binding response OmpR family regulator